MYNPDQYEVVKVLKDNERQNIAVVESKDGKKYIKREIYEDKRELYKTLMQINHPSIPKIYYVELTDKTTVIEQYIEGATLGDMVLSKRKIKSVAKQLLDAMEILHGKRIIHRDIKPDNILIDDKYRAYLVDYDIARIYRSEIKKDTESMGTFGYAPIEQYGVLPTDQKTDIYSFGVTLSHMLETAHIKCGLSKIADKCKRLDPLQRYQNAKEVKKAIFFADIKYPLLVAILLLLFFAFFVASKLDFETNNQLTVSNGTKETPTQTLNESVTAEQDTYQENLPGQQIKTENPSDEIKDDLEQQESSSLQSEQLDENEDFEGDFFGFSLGEQEQEYINYDNYSSVCVFSTDEPYEHVLFTENIKKEGKIKIGKNNTVIEADIGFDGNNISILLDDGAGDTFSQKFEYKSQPKSRIYTYNLRNNADIMCYDLDDDGGNELLVGIGECSFDKYGGRISNYYNHCLAWCIKYDEQSGFTLCSGDMISNGRSFYTTHFSQQLNVNWEKFGDVTGYYLDGTTIKPLF